MGSVIVGGARTPIGKFGGALSKLPAVDLGGLAIKASLERSGVQPGEVGYVIMGHVIQAGTGQITARQAAIAAGIPIEVPAITVNKVCLSGLNAIALADQLIRAGEVDVVVAGGMESMSQAPYVVPKARFGARLGNAEMVDAMIHDGLWSTFLRQHMGESSDEVNSELEIGREEQDEWAARSHARADAAWREGRLEPETVAADGLSRDEGIRPETTVAALAALKPAFKPDGTITAGNASQISDGAAAVVVMSQERARRSGLSPLAEVLSHGMSADRYGWLHTVPALALDRALSRASLQARDLELVEINEAFAAVALNASRMLGLSEEIVNVNGGAVAMGHPIGATGARLALTLIYELRRRRAKLGAAALCGGGGQGDALVLRAFEAN